MGSIRSNGSNAGWPSGVERLQRQGVYARLSVAWPLSGKGARRYGGCWHPVGMPALYAARELTTARSEYNQGLVPHPGLVVRLRLSGARLVDAGEPAIATAFAIPADFGGDHWRADAARNGTAASQRAGATMAAAGLTGSATLSAMRLGGNAVVLWRWNPPALAVEGPEGRLPKDAAAWR